MPDNEQLIKIIDSLQRSDERSTKALWIVVSFIFVILFTSLSLYLYKICSAISVDDFGIIFTVIVFTCSVLLFAVFINDRLKKCINQCLVVKIHIACENYDKVNCLLEKICIDKLSIKELKSILPTNPLRGN